MGKAIRALLVAALVAGGGVACGDDDDSTADEFADTTSSTAAVGDTTISTAGGEEEALAFEEDAADATLAYSLIEYEFNGPLEASAGKLFFKAVNDGTEDHELEILDPSGEPVGEIEAMPPGAEGEFAAELEPGTYKLQCILENENGKRHDDLGMVENFVVS